MLKELSRSSIKQVNRSPLVGVSATLGQDWGGHVVSKHHSSHISINVINTIYCMRLPKSTFLLSQGGSTVICYQSLEKQNSRPYKQLKFIIHDILSGGHFGSNFHLSVQVKCLIMPTTFTFTDCTQACLLSSHFTTSPYGRTASVHPQLVHLCYSRLYLNVELFPPPPRRRCKLL